MDREQAKNHIKKDLENYLESKGIDTNKPFGCLNPEHDDRNPSMSYDKKRNKAHCFSCGADYDTFDLIGIDYEIDNPSNIFNKAHELYGFSFLEAIRPTAQEDFKNGNKQDKSEQNKNESFEKYIEISHKRVGETDYFKKRGLSDGTIKAYKLGYDPHYTRSTGNPWDAVIMPSSNYSYTARNTKENIDKKDRIRKAGANILYNKKALWSGQPVFITEGEIDALSFIEVGAQAVGLGSTANAEQFLKVIQEKPPANTLILSLDNDPDGEKTTTKLIKRLEELGILFLEVNVSGDHKDPNEALVTNREAFISAVKEAQETVNAQAQEEEAEAKEKYLKTNTANYLQDFINGIAQSVNTPCISTGFNILDHVLDGGLYEGLYIIGAISSLGKTTFLLQLADQIAQGGDDVLIFSLEMARAELMAKSISRITFQLSKDSKNAKTTRGITDGKRRIHYDQIEKELIEQSIIAYSEYAKNIYIHEGMGDIGAGKIREVVKKHIKLTGKKPIVIIDYLQLLAPYDIRSTDKQNTDKAVLELKRISRDYKLAVFAISSFNRQNYSQPVTMEAFKESGAIEYSSDILIGIQAKGAGGKDFDIDKAKQKNPRELEIKILKNRNGSTGNVIPYEYYPLFNYFKEE